MLAAFPYKLFRQMLGFPGDSVVKNLPAMQETRVRFLGWEDPLEEDMAAYPLENPMDRGAWRATKGLHVTEQLTLSLSKSLQRQQVNNILGWPKCLGFSI